MFALFASNGVNGLVGVFNSLNEAYDRYTQGENGKRFQNGYVLNRVSNNIVAKYY